MFLYFLAFLFTTEQYDNEIPIACLFTPRGLNVVNPRNLEKDVKIPRT